MSQAGTLDIYIEQGASFEQVITIFDADGVTPIDITTWTFEGDIRRTYNDAAELATFTFEKTDPTNGVVAARLDADTTEGMTPFKQKDSFVYDIKATVSTNVLRVLEGSVTFKAAVTR